MFALAGPLPFAHIAVYAGMGAIFAWALFCRLFVLRAIPPLVVSVAIGLLLDWLIGGRALVGFLVSLFAAKAIYGRTVDMPGESGTTLNARNRDDS